MFTLRKIERDGAETNIYLGRLYSVVRRNQSKELFELLWKEQYQDNENMPAIPDSFFALVEGECQGSLVNRNWLEGNPDTRYYIVTNDGTTYARI